MKESAEVLAHLSDGMRDAAEMAVGIAAADRASRAQAVAAGGTNLDAILQIPVTVKVVLGTATMPVAGLVKLGRGSVVALDRKVGEPVDVTVNGRLVARGEVVVLEEDNSRFGISLTEVVGPAAPSDQLRRVPPG